MGLKKVFFWEPEINNKNKIIINEINLLQCFTLGLFYDNNTLLEELYIS